MKYLYEINRTVYKWKKIEVHIHINIILKDAKIIKTYIKSG